MHAVRTVSLYFILEQVSIFKKGYNIKNNNIIKKQIPIIILNWNGLADTLECMASLEQQTYKDIIVYLVDNGSEGADRVVLEEQFGDKKWVQLVFNPENLGFTKGNNEVLRKYILPNPAYKYVLLLNNDTIQKEDWVEQLIKSAEQNQAHMVSTKLINYFDRTKMDNAGHLMLNTGEILPIGFNEAIENYTQPFENMGPCAGAALYEVDMLRKIGVFDEYFSTGYEDAEIGVRANVLGYKTIFEPKAIVYHKISQSVTKIWNYEYIRQIQINTYYTYLKLMPLGVLLLNLPFLLLKFFMVLLISLMTFRMKLFKVYLDAHYMLLRKERRNLLKSRQAFIKTQSPFFKSQLLQKMRFFLWFDLQRFWRFVVLRGEMVFEKW